MTRTIGTASPSRLAELTKPMFVNITRWSECEPTFMTDACKVRHLTVANSQESRPGRLSRGVEDKLREPRPNLRNMQLMKNPLE